MSNFSKLILKFFKFELVIVNVVFCYKNNLRIYCIWVDLNKKNDSSSSFFDWDFIDCETNFIKLLLL